MAEIGLGEGIRWRMEYIDRIRKEYPGDFNTFIIAVGEPYVP